MTTSSQFTALFGTGLAGRGGSLDVADRFLDALDDAYVDLLRFPLSGHPYNSDDPALQAVRIGRVPAFPNYLIFYRPVEEGIDILAVLHGARDIDRLLGG